MKTILKHKLTLAIILAMLMGAANVQAVDYDLSICGVQVTDANKDNLTAAINNAGNGSTITGTVKFNSDNNTVRLENANIYTPGVAIAGSNNKVELVGNNTITSLHDGIVAVSSIEGKGTLNINITSDNGVAIGTEGYSLTIRDCTINTNGGVSIVGSDDILTFENAAITVTNSNTNYGAIIRFNDIRFNSCEINQPIGAVFNPQKKGNL
ncbi:MAG TPA: hypothetical protein GXZ87_08220 [Bacteroidales bacterium]|nr:hypothetical protein [Bacteroidales bacterium]